MARRVHNAYVETRTARAKLKAGRSYYWTRLEDGLHLGYSRQKGTGKWVVRFYLGKVRWMYRGRETTRNYEKRVIGQADDHSDANGLTILTY